jgi:putative ABC transport system permease protein
MHAEDCIRDGLCPDEARRKALIELGGVAQVRQARRERGTVPWLENLLRDARYSLRGFCHSPAFAFTAIATLALGIGASTAVFSVVDLILFRPLPYVHAYHILSVGLVQSLEREEFMMGSFYFDWLDQQRPFSAMACWLGVFKTSKTRNSASAPKA